MKQTRQAVHAIKQSIFLRCLWGTPPISRNRRFNNFGAKFQAEDDDLVAEGDDGPTRLHLELALRRLGARQTAAQNRLGHQWNHFRFPGVDAYNILHFACATYDGNKISLDFL